MSRSVRARWWQAAGACAVAVLVAAELVLAGRAVLAAPALVALLLLAYLLSPFRPISGWTHWRAQERLVRHESAVVYWRPGCRHCLRLRLHLARARLGKRVSWVDIWADPEGAAYVRDLNEGSEIVPTVILPDGSAVTNPEPSLLVAALTQPGSPSQGDVSSTYQSPPPRSGA
ncbi:MAG: glutaredoxin domain-containing protein, partial [Micrococcales bacterium]|nr:glutaredoxin domain-containing protein [Micrococcales bacterium]